MLDAKFEIRGSNKQDPFYAPQNNSFEDPALQLVVDFTMLTNRIVADEDACPG